jgi:PhnB protein
MQISPYLNFTGNCAEAFAFYEQCLGGKIVFVQKYGDSPAAGEVPPGWADAVLHVRLEVGNFAILGSDAPPQHYHKPEGMMVSINVQSAADGERIFNQLSNKGTATMPFQKTFWSPGFGMAVDRFGIPWMVNSEQA